MTDDHLITLWSLAGMELWNEFRQSQFEVNQSLIWTKNENGWVTSVYDVTSTTNPLYIVYRRQIYLRLYPSSLDEILYVVHDLVIFNPDERWWKLLFAKRWYEKNKEQFND